jgi:hypothetical protein
MAYSSSILEIKTSKFITQLAFTRHDSQVPMGGGLGAGGRPKRSLRSSSVVTPERPRREAKTPVYYT